MELDKAIEGRISVRSYTEKPVEKTLIEEILALAVKAPSWGNTQPWELAVVGGQAKESAFRRTSKPGNGGCDPEPGLYHAGQFFRDLHGPLQDDGETLV